MLILWHFYDSMKCQRPSAELRNHKHVIARRHVCVHVYDDTNATPSRKIPATTERLLRGLGAFLSMFDRRR
jgi:hypothetical protein